MDQAPKQKQKHCKVCRRPFRPFSSLHRFCSPECVLEDVRVREQRKQQRAEKQFRASQRRAKDDQKRKPELNREVREALHEFIRALDRGQTCISCPTQLGQDGGLGGYYDAGHFLGQGANPEPARRFDPLNIHGQCKRCNRHLEGNTLAFQDGLVARYGQPLVDHLRGPQPALHLSRVELRQLRDGWRARAAEARKILRAGHLVDGVDYRMRLWEARQELEGTNAIAAPEILSPQPVRRFTA